MTTRPTSLGQRFRPVLQQREAELRALLHASLLANTEPGERQDGVGDFKDIAAEQSLDIVDEAQAEHAATELEQVVAALQRADDGSYGRCLDCDEPIDERRLEAMPAAAYCLTCQALQEHSRAH